MEAVLSVLKCKAVKVTYSAVASIDHDVMRYVFKNKGIVAADGKCMFYEKDDFSRFILPKYWYYYLSELGIGIAVDFPIKLKTVLGYSFKRFILDSDKKLVGAPKFPTEKAVLFINRKACNENNIWCYNIF